MKKKFNRHYKYVQIIYLAITSILQFIQYISVVFFDIPLKVLHLLIIIDDPCIIKFFKICFTLVKLYTSLLFIYANEISVIVYIYSTFILHFTRT